MQKYGWEGFCLTYVEPKHKSDEHNQAGTNDFQHLIWLFWVCRLSPAWYNIDCCQWMSLIDHINHRAYSAQIFVYVSVVFLSFLK